MSPIDASTFVAYLIEYLEFKDMVTIVGALEGDIGGEGSQFGDGVVARGGGEGEGVEGGEGGGGVGGGRGGGVVVMVVVGAIGVMV